MLIEPSINEIKEKVDSKYTLVLLTAKRARDLIDGASPMVETHPYERAVSIAADELSEDYYSFEHVAPEEEEDIEAELEAVIDAAIEDAEAVEEIPVEE